MLTITNKQMIHFSDFLFGKFEKDTLLHLKENHAEPLSGSSDHDIKALIGSGIKKAAAYKIKDRAAVLRFIELIVLLGPDFEKKPQNKWANDVLMIRNLHGIEKMKRIDKRYRSFVNA